MVEPVSTDPAVSMDAISRAVCSHYGITKMALVSQRRARNIARPRQVAMYLGRELTPLSFPQIGRHLGNRDHTTIMYGADLIEKLSKSDPVIARDLITLWSALTHQTEAA